MNPINKCTTPTTTTTTTTTTRTTTLPSNEQLLSEISGVTDTQNRLKILFALRTRYQETPAFNLYLEALGLEASIIEEKADENAIKLNGLSLKKEHILLKEQIVKKISDIKSSWMKYLDETFHNVKSACNELNDYQQNLKKERGKAKELIMQTCQLSTPEERTNTLQLINKVGCFALGEADGTINSYDHYTPYIENLLNSHNIAHEKKFNKYKNIINTEIQKIHKELESISLNFNDTITKHLFSYEKKMPLESTPLNIDLLARCNDILETEISFLKQKETEIHRVSGQICLAIRKSAFKSTSVYGAKFVLSNSELEKLCLMSIEHCSNNLSSLSSSEWSSLRQEGAYTKGKKISEAIKRHVSNISSRSSVLEDDTRAAIVHGSEIMAVSKLINSIPKSFSDTNQACESEILEKSTSQRPLKVPSNISKMKTLPPTSLSNIINNNKAIEVSMPGIKNCGNSCYMNSALQAMLTSPLVVNLIKSYKIKDLMPENEKFMVQLKAFLSAYEDWLLNHSIENQNKIDACAENLRNVLYETHLKKEEPGSELMSTFDAHSIIQIVADALIALKYNIITQFRLNGKIEGSGIDKDIDYTYTKPSPHLTLVWPNDGTCVGSGKLQTRFDLSCDPKEPIDLNNWPVEVNGISIMPKKVFQSYKIEGNPPPLIVFSVYTQEGDEVSQNAPRIQYQVENDDAILNTKQAFIKLPESEVQYRLISILTHISGKTGHWKTWSLRGDNWYEMSDSDVTNVGSNVPNTPASIMLYELCETKK